MQRLRFVATALLASVASFFPISSSTTVADDDPTEPLVLSAVEDEKKDEPEILPEEIVQKNDEEEELVVEFPIETEDASESTQEDGDDQNAIILDESSAPVLDENERRKMENDPLFKDFSDAFNQLAPQTAPIAPFVAPNAQNDSNRELAIDPNRQALLDESLAIADVDLDALDVLPSHRATLQRIDREIARLWPVWIDAELNRNVVGRRERDWRGADPTKFVSAAHRLLDAPGNDWAIALDDPFFFKVVDPESGEEFYTQAGDFERLDASDYVALARNERRYVLELEPGTVAPTGRSFGVKILKNGKVQGMDASGKFVADVHLATIPLYAFANPARLDSKDGVFFTPTIYSGEPNRIDLPANAKVGIEQGKIGLSNGDPDAILAQIALLCKSKKRLVEILTQPQFAQTDPLPTPRGETDRREFVLEEPSQEEPPFLEPQFDPPHIRPELRPPFFAPEPVLPPPF